MKKFILLAFTALMMVGCTDKKGEVVKNMSVDGYILKEKEIDSCEYFMVHVSPYMDGYLPLHKNNCRFCKERRQKELEELVEQIKEK